MTNLQTQRGAAGETDVPNLLFGDFLTGPAIFFDEKFESGKIKGMCDLEEIH